MVVSAYVNEVRTGAGTGPGFFITLPKIQISMLALKISDFPNG